MTKAVLAQISFYNTSAGVWVALNYIHAPNSIARVMQSKQSIQTTKEGNKTVQEHFSTMCQIRNNLALEGELLTDMNLVVLMMNGLGSLYTPLVITVKTRIEKIHLDELHGMLLNFEQKLVMNNEVMLVKLEDNISINYASRYRPKNNYQRNNHTGQNLLNQLKQGIMHTLTLIIKSLTKDDALLLHVMIDSIRM